MKIKVSEATNIQIDWMVAKCEDINTGFPGYWSNSVLQALEDGTENPFAYSTNWQLGGPIIERERIDLVCQPQHKEEPWHSAHRSKTGNGSTPLIAAMRCFICSRLGEEVEVPDELA